MWGYIACGMLWKDEQSPASCSQMGSILMKAHYSSCIQQTTLCHARMLCSHAWTLKGKSSMSIAQELQPWEKAEYNSDWRLFWMYSSTTAACAVYSSLAVAQSKSLRHLHTTNVTESSSQILAGIYQFNFSRKPLEHGSELVCVDTIQTPSLLLLKAYKRENFALTLRQQSHADWDQVNQGARDDTDANW